MANRPRVAKFGVAEVLMPMWGQSDLNDNPSSVNFGSKHKDQILDGSEQSDATYPSVGTPIAINAQRRANVQQGTLV